MGGGRREGEPIGKVGREEEGAGWERKESQVDVLPTILRIEDSRFLLPYIHYTHPHA